MQSAPASSASRTPAGVGKTAGVPGYNEWPPRSHVQDGADFGPATPDRSLPAMGTAVPAERSHTNQGGNRLPAQNADVKGGDKGPLKKSIRGLEFR